MERICGAGKFWTGTKCVRERIVIALRMEMMNLLL